jgi:putative endonuclease
VNSRQRFGSNAEVYAVSHLERQGYRLLERNYRCRAGEVDAVLMDRDTIVFLEVRARRGDSYGTPEESITAKKAQHLAATAETFLEANGCTDANWRVDLVALEASQDGKLTRLRHHTNAIEECGQSVSGGYW